MGLTENGKALCYVNNFGNGKNSIGGTELPYVTLYRTTAHDYGSNVGDVNVYRNYTVSVGGDYYSRTNYQHIINSLEIILYGYDTSYSREYYLEDIGAISTVYSASYNKENDEVSYINPIILHSTKTIKADHNVIIRRVELWAENFLTDVTHYRESSWDQDYTKSKLASVDINDMDLYTGDTATFTITVG